MSLGPKRPKEGQRGRAWIEQACFGLGWLASGWLVGWLKASKRLLVAASQKVASFISNSHIGKPFFERHQILNKGLQKARGCPKPKSSQF